MKEIPDYSNSATKETEERLGPYVYDKPNLVPGDDIITRGPYKLDNGAVYTGQWTKEGSRQGKGM